MMPLTQSVETCLEPGIGAAGLSRTTLDRYLERLIPALASLREAHASGVLPLLRVPERRDDIDPARQAITALSQDAKTIVFFGTGGSSLGGQTLAQLAGYGVAGADGGGNRPRICFCDNLDPLTLQAALDGLDLAATRFVITSKSGNTPETLVQAIAAIEAARAAGLANRIPKMFLGLTEPRSEGVTNGLRDLCEALSIPTLPHEQKIGGRFSALTNVGLLPALAAGLDVVALREGAQGVVSAMLAAAPNDFAPAVGAAIAVGLAKEKGVKASVMLAYSDRLQRFAAWYVQLWGESLGKRGEGTTPVAALGPVDQHSQLQLYLDGAPHHLITVLRIAAEGLGPRVAPDLAGLAHADYLAGHTAGDLVAAQQKAIPEALVAAGRPVRTIDMARLDERALGTLMMHFMLETILAGALLGVDPFDQPAVESGKIIARRYLSEKQPETRHGDTPTAPQSRQPHRRG
jgi:glucose-6-phosphate isomerase